jgi:hypothetical protein
MNRLWHVAAALALMVTIVWTSTSSSADDKEPSIKDIMTKAHKGGDALISKLGKALKEKEVPWEAVQKQSKELLDLGKALGKAKPPKGEAESWEKLTKAYVETATALNEAAEKKEKKDAAAAHKKLTGMCMDCHKAHKGK